MRWWPQSRRVVARPIRFGRAPSALRRLDVPFRQPRHAAGVSRRVLCAGSPFKGAAAGCYVGAYCASMRKVDRSDRSESLLRMCDTTGKEADHHIGSRSCDPSAHPSQINRSGSVDS
ncbi:hypothetical protein PYW08_001009 [Mythimna loreyi]|uniref:Uncharacterized protein n=2 Tax=Mythimna loreyi TaxID=667449 RepID=A0ACC2R3G0_9NEOP|nr:hypothetical protein PYW08_001008 [Mythimna loreyi]KAJ8729428.1 hypothetical protein PYW08_001009 [Mythimna loreyi]